MAGVESLILGYIRSAGPWVFGHKAYCDGEGVKLAVCMQTEIFRSMS